MSSLPGTCYACAAKDITFIKPSHTFFVFYFLFRHISDFNMYQHKKIPAPFFVQFYYFFHFVGLSGYQYIEMDRKRKFMSEVQI